MSIERTVLEAFQILDLTQGFGQYASRLLADLGADVIRVEPPGGGAARQALPFANDIPDVERSIPFLHLNANKRSIVLDPMEQSDRATVMALAADADAVVEDFTPGRLASLGLGYADLRKMNPSIVLTSITPFGQTGPHAQLQGNDLIAQAMSDWLFNVGDEGDLPCAAPGDISVYIGGTHGALGTLLAVVPRDVVYRREVGVAPPMPPCGRR